MNTALEPRQNIVLIGFMGCGKTTIGRELHHRLGYPFVDMDQIIEQRQGETIPEIFAKRGEAAFREMESRLLRELAVSPLPRQILSTGGGVIERDDNLPVLRRLGYVVWLSATPEVILERTSKSRNRPLLQGGDAAEKIRTLLARRVPRYRSVAHLEVDTDGLDFGEIAGGILESARYFFSRDAREAPSNRHSVS